jgi:hypothetical protein
LPVEDRGIFRRDNIDIAVNGLAGTPMGKAFADRLGKLEEIAREARTRNCIYFRCRLGHNPTYPVFMRFADRYGREYRISLCFRRDYEKYAEYLGLNDALALKVTVQYLFLNDEGFSGSWPGAFPAVPLEDRIKGQGGTTPDAQNS